MRTALNKRLIYLIFALIVFLTKASGASVMHLVSGTIRYGNGDIPDSVSLSAYIVSRPDEILTQGDAGCGYEDGYYWIQCGNFSTEWQAGDVLHIDASDTHGFIDQGEVTLTHAAVDPMNLVIEIVTYQITVGTDPDGLEFVVDDTTYSAARSFTWIKDTHHEISVPSPQDAGPDVQYHFDRWSNGQPQTHSVVADMDQTIIGSFIPKYRLTAHSNPEAGGSIELTPEAEFYFAGTVITMKAVSDSVNGYLFTNWGGDLSGSSNPDTLQIGDGPKSVTANFELRTHTLQIQTNPAEAGTVVVDPEKSDYTFGEIVQLEAVPDTDFVFYRWSGDVTDTSRSISVVMNRDQFVMANFRKEGIVPPRLIRCFPPNGNVYIPRNANIQMVIESDPFGEGLDDQSLNITVDDTLIIQNGVVQIGKEVEVQNQDNKLKILYNPLFDFSEYKEVTVRVECRDNVSPDLFLDSTYSFTTGPAEMILTKSQIINRAGGLIDDWVLDIQIVIPENVLKDTTKILCGFFGTEIPLPDTLEQVSLVYYFGPDGLQFTDFVTLAIPYNQGNLMVIDVDTPYEIPVYYFSTHRGVWEKIPVVDADADHFYVKVKTFGFLVFGKIITSDVLTPDLSTHQIPKKFELLQNFPNPFNPITHIRFQVARMSDVSIEIYNVMGQWVKTILVENVRSGFHEISWDGTNDRGMVVNSGLYYTVMKVGNQCYCKKMLFLK
jgi:hypothetical protein